MLLNANLFSMSLPNKDAANAATLADLLALNAAADAKFILLATDLINDAILRGVYFVSINSFEYCDLVVLAKHFSDLGYAVAFPDSIHYRCQPAQLFGQAWFDYWRTNGVPPEIKNPARIIISWL